MERERERDRQREREREREGLDGPWANSKVCQLNFLTFPILLSLFPISGAPPPVFPSPSLYSSSPDGGAKIADVSPLPKKKENFLVSEGLQSEKEKEKHSNLGLKLGPQQNKKVGRFSPLCGGIGRFGPGWWRCGCGGDRGKEENGGEN